MLITMLSWFDINLNIALNSKSSDADHDMILISVQKLTV